MNYTFVNGGWVILIPSIIQIIILSSIIILTFFIGRATSLNHLIKHHLDDIRNDEVIKIRQLNNRLIIKNKKLLEDKKLYMEILSGIRYLTKKEIKE